MNVLIYKKVSFFRKMWIKLILLSFKFKFRRKNIFKQFLTDYYPDHIQKTGLCILVRNSIIKSFGDKDWVGSLELSITLAIRQGKIFPELQRESCIKLAKKYHFELPNENSVFFYTSGKNINRWYWFNSILKEYNL